MKRHHRNAIAALLLSATAPLVLGVPGALGGEAAEPARRSARPLAAPEVDHLNLAAVLFRDGHLDRAERALEKVDPGAETVDRQRYHMLRGMIALRQGRWEQAIEALEEAVHQGGASDLVWARLAQANFELGRWARAVHMIDNVEEMPGDKMATLQLMKARAELEQGQRQKAWQTLSQGAERFPHQPEFQRQRFFLLVDMGLYQAAAEVGADFVRRPEVGADDFLAVALAFRRSEQHARAQAVLEEARLRFAGDPEATAEITTHLAYAYAEDEQPLAGGDLLQRAAWRTPRFTRESAELYRRAGATQRALYMNQQLTDQQEKLRQRVALLIDDEAFEEIASLQPRLERLGLLQDQQLVYALAYAHFHRGSFGRAEALLKLIDDPAIFDNAMTLRRMMASCHTEPDLCGL